MISEKAPAKINLSLDVLRKRDDGYHDLEMVMTTIDLADRLDFFHTDSSDIYVQCSTGFIPSDERNLAYRAAALLKQRYGITDGVSIYIQKNIPVAAGLAGGSSDAAATLRGLNRLWNLGLTMDELVTIGKEIGSDVPFCVYGGTALVTGRGDMLQPLNTPPPCWVVLAKPNISVSTREVYEALAVGRIAHRPNTRGMVEAIKNMDYDSICFHMRNVLEEVTMSLFPEVRVYKQLIQQFGADAVLMSGSGPTVFALLRQENRVRRLVNALKGFCPEVYAVRLLGTGISLQENV